jgi:excisionase family DNA binding protein
MSLAFLSEASNEELISFIEGVVDAQLSKHFDVVQVTPWLTVEEAASRYRTTAGAIYKRIRRGKLPAHRPEGSRIMLNRDEVDHLLDPDSQRTYDSRTVNLRPREAGTSGAVAPGGTS